MPRRNSVGQPTKINRKRIAVVCAEIEKHYVITKAANAIGVHHTTITNWYLRGQDDRQAGLKTIFSYFVQRFDAAVAEWEHRHVENISKAGDGGDWRASVTLLQARMPEKYGRRERIDFRVIDERIERELARVAGRGEAALPEPLRNAANEAIRDGSEGENDFSPSD